MSTPAHTTPPSFREEVQVAMPHTRDRRRAATGHMTLVEGLILWSTRYMETDVKLEEFLFLENHYKQVMI